MFWVVFSHAEIHSLSLQEFLKAPGKYNVFRLGNIQNKQMNRTKGLVLNPPGNLLAELTSCVSPSDISMLKIWIITTDSVCSSALKQACLNLRTRALHKFVKTVEWKDLLLEIFQPEDAYNRFQMHRPPTHILGCLLWGAGERTPKNSLSLKETQINNKVIKSSLSVVNSR